jgi:hypothetical protein
MSYSRSPSPDAFLEQEEIEKLEKLEKLEKIEKKSC